MVKKFDWEKTKSETKIRTQGYQLVDDMFETEFERILKVDDLKSFQIHKLFGKSELEQTI